VIPRFARFSGIPARLRACCVGNFPILLLLTANSGVNFVAVLCFVKNWRASRLDTELLCLKTLAFKANTYNLIELEVGGGGKNKILMLSVR
jgi:hypothetical protein